MKVRKHALSALGTFVTPARLFLVLVILGFGLRIVYGAVRYRSDLTNLSGNAFIEVWHDDALYHVLIAKALLSGKGYVVDDAPLKSDKPIRYSGQEALFKAPLYEFFLAGVFAISGFSFKLFFPLQALFGGFLSGFIGLITLHIFRRTSAAYFAGFAAAFHPILVNSGSQPYNENLFFVLFCASIWAFLIWFQTKGVRWAILCGIMIGLCVLTRENGVLLLVAMGIVLLIATRWSEKDWVGYSVIALITVAVIAPWTIRNYVRFGVFVPVASIVGGDLLEGNNECIASESILLPFWSEGPCPWADDQRRSRLEATVVNSSIPAAVIRDRISRSVAVQFILKHPGIYAKLALRRFWTTFLPYDPRANQRLHERIVLVLYWLLVFPAGIAGMALSLQRITISPGRMLLGSLVLLNFASIAAVLYWSDLRFRIGIDLLLGCFAGWTYRITLLSKTKTRHSGSRSTRIA